MKYANLHLHSVYSDAGFTPRQLVLIGKSLGYKALALTDHETDGGNKDFFDACRSEGIDCFTGAEFYGNVDGQNVHLTAIDFDPADPGLRSYIKERCDLQESITQKTFEIGVKLGIITDITWQDVLDNTAVGTWICIDSVINTFRNKKITPKEGFGPIRSKVFNSPEARALKMPYPTAERVIKTVRKAGGVIALAHSGYYTFPYLERLMEFGLNGIETGHPNIKPSILPELVAAA
ncbi:MAG: PHP domain-containing protein, partial [Clostridia bacterium]|nr:PHP domain-containing protein [Clostridia bacterium]